MKKQVPKKKKIQTPVVSSNVRFVCALFVTYFQYATDLEEITERINNESDKQLSDKKKYEIQPLESKKINIDSSFDTADID